MTPNEAYSICRREKKRKPELEPIILTNSCSSYLYAKDIMKGRWPEAEPIILTDFYFSYCYALDIIKGRWIEAEPRIKQDEDYWQEYCLYFNIKKNKCNWKIGL